MKNPFTHGLSELAAAADRKRRQEIRKKLRIPPSFRITGFELDCLGYQLVERSGPIFVKLEGEKLKVGDPDQSACLTYHGDAVDLVLHAWAIGSEDAERGIIIELSNGCRK